MKTNQKLTKIICGAASTSIMITSCDPYSELDNLYNQQSVLLLSENNGLGKNAVPIDLHLKKDDVEYINFLQKLTKKIIEDPKVAKEFSDNPQAYVDKLGYKKKINIDDSLLKIILALGDEEILRAIEDNNLEKFISLCQSKKLLTMPEMFSKDYYKNQINDLRQKLPQASTKTLVEEDFSPIAIMVVVVVVGFGFLVAVSAALVFGTKVKGINADEVLNKSVSDFADKNPVINVWTLKKGCTFASDLIDQSSWIIRF